MRLKNIQVDEVSLVDKAANKRKFAFLKRDTTPEPVPAPVAVPVVKADAVKEEVIEAQKIVDAEEFTPEELETLRKIHTELIELAAQVKKN
jgi:hypothetical protein